MAYNGTDFEYTEGDVATSAVSGLAKAFITIGSFVTLIILVLLYKWFRKHK